MIGPARCVCVRSAPVRAGPADRAARFTVACCSSASASMDDPGMECPFEPRKAVDMTRDELLERYEALGEERDFEAARPQFEQALAEEPDARVLSDYGYLLESHARRE